MSRHDLTEWIIHFVHRRNPENDHLLFGADLDPFEEYGSHPFPDGYTYDGKELFLTDEYEEEEYGLDPEADAFEVLKKILHDGYIRAGWSYRSGNPTIYGPKAAVCFTEMPLYGLIEYAKVRANEDYTEQYGLAFLRKELFRAGARPVIYGLSGRHIEAQVGDLNFGIGLRTLAAECGLGIKEQYRYVYTNFRSDKPIDWTHEREWRWADLDESFSWPGMPVFAQNDKFTFQNVIVIVKTIDECDKIIDLLKNLFHSESTNYGREYNLNVISNTRILVLEELAKISKDPALVRIEDLPLHKMPQISKIEVAAELLERVEKAVAQASEIYYEATKAYAEQYGDPFPAGWSHVVLSKPNSPITQALMDLKLANSYAEGRYYISMKKSYPVQSMYAQEAGAKAAAKFLSEALQEDFNYENKLD